MWGFEQQWFKMLVMGNDTVRGKDGHFKCCFLWASLCKWCTIPNNQKLQEVMEENRWIYGSDFPWSPKFGQKRAPWMRMLSSCQHFSVQGVGCAAQWSVCICCVTDAEMWEGNCAVTTSLGLCRLCLLFLVASCISFYNTSASVSYRGRYLWAFPVQKIKESSRSTTLFTQKKLCFWHILYFSLQLSVRYTELFTKKEFIEPRETQTRIH